MASTTSVQLPSIGVIDDHGQIRRSDEEIASANHALSGEIDIGVASECPRASYNSTFLPPSSTSDGVRNSRSGAPMWHCGLAP